MELNQAESITRPDNSRVFYQAVVLGKYSIFEDANHTLLDAPGIYCIFNSESNMLYVGCSLNVKSRIKTHKSHLSRGIHICRLMSDDYERNPENFRFFPIVYVDESNFTLHESIRNHLFSLEVQYLKRVPLAGLYNSLMPASLSEKLLLSEQPKRRPGIPITDIISRLGMSADSIKTNGFAPGDVLTHEKAVEFLQKRTVAAGRFPEEKAAIAREYLKEISGSESGSDESDNLLIRGSVIDYFDRLYADQPGVSEVKKIEWVEVSALAIAFVLPTLASAFNTYNVSHQLSQDVRVSFFVMGMVMLTPALFIVARIGKVGVFVAVCVVAFETFCNATASYLSLMGDMEYVLGGKRGQCSEFLNSVAQLTNSDHRPTAVLLAVWLSLLIAMAQLMAFSGIRKRV